MFCFGLALCEPWLSWNYRVPPASASHGVLPLPLMGCCHCHLFLYLTALTRAHLHSYTYEMLERVCKQKTAVVAQSDIECFPAMYMDEAFLGLNPSITINWAWWGP